MKHTHTQLTDDLQERASLYAAGAMTDSERLEYARHLEEDECAVCLSEVNELQSAVSLLAFTAPPSSPSPRVKARLIEQARAAAPVAAVPPWWRRGLKPATSWVAAAVAVASVAAVFIVTRSNTELQRATARLNGRIAELEGQVDLLTSTGVRVVDLAGQGDHRQASGRIFWDQERRQWFFYVRGLTPVAADMSYQLWFVPASGDPVSAQVFNTDASGFAEIEIPVPDGLGDLKAAAVTPEPFGGVLQPTGSFALLGAL